jgi:hypothetical protein
MAAASTARAQVPPPDAPVVAPHSVFPVQIENGERSSSIQLFVEGGEISCSAGCSLSLPGGAYNLAVTDAHGNRSSQSLYLQMPSRAVVTPANHAARVGGFALLGASLAGAVVGVVAVIQLAGTKSNACTTNCKDWVPWMYASGIGFGAAFAFAITGFMLQPIRVRNRTSARPRWRAPRSG